MAGRSTRSLELTVGSEAFLAVGQFWVLPAVLTAVSVAYFVLAEKGAAVRVKVLASAHGFAAAAIYLGALAIWASGASRMAYQAPFFALFLLPVASIGYAVLRYPGSKAVHLLQLINLPSIAGAIFIGAMAVGGEWL